MKHRVYFVLDTNFTDDLWLLSRTAHVWLIRSVHNEAAARTVWERGESIYSPLFGVTVFDASENTIETFYDLLGTIDQHHGEYSTAEPWFSIHVAGLSLEHAQSERIA